MKTEFSKFKAEIDLQKATNPMDVKLLLEISFKKFQLKLDNSERYSQRRFHIHDFQSFLTQRCDILYHQNMDNLKIAEPFISLLQHLKLQYSNKFKNTAAVPLLYYLQHQQELMPTCEYIKKQIKKYPLDKDLIDSIHRFLNLEKETNKGQLPSWEKIDALNSFCSAFKRVLEINKGSPDNKKAIFDFLVQNNFNCMQAQQSSLVEDFIQSPLYPPIVYNQSPGVYMLVFYLFIKIGFIQEPDNKVNFFMYLSKRTRGPKGQKYKASTLRNRFYADQIKNFEKAKRIFKEAIIQLEELENEFYEKRA